MIDRIRTSLLISPILILGLLSEIFLFLILFSICVFIVLETNLNAKKNIRIFSYLMVICAYFLLLFFTYDVIIYTIFISLLSFVISIFFNFLTLKKNSKNSNLTNQISLDNKGVINLFFLRETSTIYYLSGILCIL